MKKVVIATMLFVSTLAMPVTQTQAQTYDATTLAPAQNDMGQAGIAKWIFQDVVYEILSEAISAAWGAIKSNNSSDVEEGCKFLEDNTGERPTECD